MSVNYQQLERYKGSLYGALQQNGIEYDWETPDNQVIGSPGGVSGIHHHYTKGMYSPSSSYSDIYGGESPAYVYGEHGNLYQTGQSSAYQAGVFQQPRDPMFTQNEGTLRRDNFIPDSELSGSASGATGNMEMIPPPDSTAITNPATGEMIPQQNVHDTIRSVTNRVKDIMGAGKILNDDDREEIKQAVQAVGHKMKNVVVLPNPWTIFFLLFVLWMAMAFLMYASEGLITTKLHGGVPLNWKWYLFYAVIFTVILLVLTSFVDISILRLEGV